MERRLFGECRETGRGEALGVRGVDRQIAAELYVTHLDVDVDVDVRLF